MMSTRAQDDAMMWAIAGLLGAVALGALVTSIVLFTKKMPLAGVLVLIGAVVCGLAAFGIAGLMILASFAWH